MQYNSLASEDHLHQLLLVRVVLGQQLALHAVERRAHRFEELQVEPRLAAAFRLRYPTEMELQIEHWADKGEPSATELKQHLIVDKGIMSISPKEAELAPGEQVRQKLATEPDGAQRPRPRTPRGRMSRAGRRARPRGRPAHVPRHAASV